MRQSDAGVSNLFSIIVYCDKISLFNFREALFYQILLYDFENFGEIKFEDPGLSVRELILLALDSEESGWTPEDGPIEDLATTVRDILVKKAIILREYYSFQISEDGRLLQLPLLLGKPTQSHEILTFYYNVTVIIIFR